MPDMPQPAPGGAPPSGSAPGGAPPVGGGDAPPNVGSFAEVIANVDGMVEKITTAISKSQMPDEIKSAWADALASLRKAEQALVQAAGGEADGQSEPDQDDQGGATTMQQGGAKGAVPMTHQNMRG